MDGAVIVTVDIHLKEVTSLRLHDRCHITLVEIHCSSHRRNQTTGREKTEVVTLKIDSNNSLSNYSEYTPLYKAIFDSRETCISYIEYMNI